MGKSLENHSRKEIPKGLRNLPYATYPCDPEYNRLRFSFNKRFDVKPHVIIAPRDNEEAIYTLKQLKKHHLEFSIRSGGHCYENGCLSPGYYFDLSNFNQIIPDIEKEEVFIGSGCRLGDVIKKLGEIDYAIPTGTCSQVGAGGLTLGGGIGMLTPMYGLTCDSVKSFLVLNSKCKIITVDQDLHPDLFWSLRASGNCSYCLVLGFQFKMHYIPRVIYYELTWNWDSEQVPIIINAWQTFAQNLPPRTSSQMRMKYQSEKSETHAEIGIAGLKILNRRESTSIDFLNCFTRGNGNNDSDEKNDNVLNKNLPKIKFFIGSYKDSSTYWTENPKEPYAKMKSKIMFDPLSDNVIAKIMKYFAKLQREKPEFHLLFDFDGIGDKVKESTSSFYPKKLLSWWYQGYYWNSKEMTETCLRYSRKFYDSISSEVSDHSYCNCSDYDLGPDYLRAYYGDNVIALTAIKRKYDPHNFFRWHQSIPLYEDTDK